VPESHSSNSRSVDWLGATIATLGLTGLVYGFLEPATLGWAHPLVMTSLIAGFACLVLFAFVE
jgi:hypothetical protein